VVDVIGIVEACAREATLFAAVGFLIGGIDDLVVDALYGLRYLRRRWRGVRELTLSDMAPPRARLAVFVPAWDEAAVIGPMLRTALARFDHPGYRIYVGTYPNDRATIDAVAEVAESDPRVRLVVGPRAGPTTKADNLNALWRALKRDEAATGVAATGIVLHDAEDVVHRHELRVFDEYLTRFDAVQLPVFPLPDPRSRLIGGTYIDEFAEAHGKQLVVREAIGAGLPFAGTGCAIRAEMIARIADARDGRPFDAASLTEDYELGLTIAAMGGRTTLAWVTEADRRTPVAVRALFPARLEPAMRQRSRWMIGIALAGWDRVGWGHWSAIGEHWMRMRDRRSPLAVIVLLAAYAAFVLWGASAVLHWTVGSSPLKAEPWLRAVLLANAAMLAWRLAVRASFVGRIYGAREAALSLPRVLVGNLIALVAARRALFRYASMLRGEALVWDKTSHSFPDDVAEALR